jgi:hypothetical protein
VMMTYWRGIITITIKRKTIERVKKQKDNPTALDIHSIIDFFSQINSLARSIFAFSKIVNQRVLW